MRRILLSLILAVGLAPGIVWRNGPPPPDHSQSVQAIALPLPTGGDTRIGRQGGPVLTGAWQLVSPNSGFESYSALLALDGGKTLLAISDRGQFARFAAPGETVGRIDLKPVELGAVLPGSDAFKPLQDMEAATRDPVSGRIWLGLEGRNAILRLKPDLSDPEFAYPPAMQGWASNSGPESLVRLADGRFLTLSEGGILRDGDFKEALLFDRDPLEGGDPLRFTLRPPSGFAPTDAAQLPDGRVIILLRGFEMGLPPRFTTRLLLADPATIRAGEAWQWEDIGGLGAAIPHENYEGLAVSGGEDGGPVTLWLLSDDNGATFIQRTLLLRFTWKPWR